MDISPPFASVTSPRFFQILLPPLPPLVSFTTHAPSPHRFASSFKPVATPRCLPDQSAFAGTKLADPAALLAVKRKAVALSPELKGTSIFLVGINNPVKTGLGKLLAEALRYYCFDSDSLVVEAAGGDAAARALKEADEKGFQECETEVLKQLSSMGRLVVCTGDGAVQSSTNLGLLRHGISIWIDVPLDMAAKGVSSDAEVIEELVAAYERSREGYATADATISLQNVASKLGFEDTVAVGMEDIALEVLKEIEKLTRIKKMMAEAARPF